MKTLTLVRGLPGSGRTTRARFLAGNDGFLIDGEAQLPQWLCPLSEVGMEQSEAAAMILLERRITEGCERIICEQTFPTLSSMRPVARLATRAGYGIVFDSPQTDWANDPAGCKRHSSREVALSSLHTVQRYWEAEADGATVLKSRPPHERLFAAKHILAELDQLRAAGKEDSESYQDKARKLTEDYSPEIGRLFYLGYFDPKNREQVTSEYAVIIELGDQAMPTLEVEPTYLSAHALEVAAGSRIPTPPVAQRTGTE